VRFSATTPSIGERSVASFNCWRNSDACAVAEARDACAC
jgi:hypothetical protein